MKCKICGREFDIDDLFCLEDCEMANKTCEQENHPVVCERCLEKIVSCIISNIE